MQLCDEIMAVLSRTGILIRYNCCEVEGIVREIKTISPLFHEVPDEIVSDMDIGDILLSSIDSSVLYEEESSILTRYCSELGKTDTEGQFSMLDSLKELTSELRRHRAEEYTKYGKLYRSVGVMFGLMAGIAII